MTRQWGSPDLPPEPDAVTLRELVRLEHMTANRHVAEGAIGNFSAVTLETRIGQRRSTHGDLFYRWACSACGGTGRWTRQVDTAQEGQRRHPAICVPRTVAGARDVALVTDTGRRLINSQPVRPLGLNRRRTPAVALVPVAAALCVVIALAAIGAAHVTVFAARHWIGALMLVALCWAASLLIRGCRRRER